MLNKLIKIMKKRRNAHSEIPVSRLTKLIMVMRLTVFLCVFGFSHVLAASTYSQSTKLTLDVKSAKLSDILLEIETKSGFHFIYSNKLIDTDQLLAVKLTDKKIDEVLSAVLAGTDIDFTRIEKQIILSRKGSELNRFLSAQPSEASQQISVRGKVTDTYGMGLPGVAIVVKGTQQGTISDEDGNYTLSDVPPDALLVFSLLGMETQEVPVDNRSIIHLVMTESSIALDQAVAIGYGSVKKKDLTGSVTSLNIEESPLSTFSNQNALEALRGEASGVNVGLVTQAGGEPSLEIRGQNSIYGSNYPLIVLDGVLFTGSMSDINPNDIATFDILRDAVSAAVYGARSANGVIVITTKKGKTDKPTFSFNSSTGFRHWSTKPKLMNGTQYLEVFNAKNRQPASSTVNLTGSELRNYENGIETDWLDLVLRTGVVQDYQLAVSGTTNKLNYYLSSAYNDTRNVIIGDDFKRISILSKLDMDVTDWMNLGLDLNLSRRDYSGVAASLANAMTLPPWTSPYRNEAGDLEKYPRENSYVNPLWGVEDGTRDNRNVNNMALLRAHAVIKVPWVEGLEYTINYQNSIERQDIENFFYESYYINEGAGLDRYSPERVQSLLVMANGSLQERKTNSYVIDNILSYRRDINKHNLYVTAVATRDKKSFYDVAIKGTDFSDNGNTSLGVWGYNKAKVLTSTVDSYVATNIGYLVRLNYSYDNKYYVSGSVRRDGASVFGANTKWGTFSALGLAWRLSEEGFFKGSGVLNDLKLRLSWGQNGNQGIGPYTTLSTVRNGLAGGSVYTFPDEPETFYYGLYQDRLGNPNLGWETTEAINTGFESAWLNNRVFLDLDLYFTKTTDQLFDRVIPIMSGFNTMKASMGQVNNRGVELTLRTINIRNNKSWNWETSVYAWKNSNKLAHLYGEDLDGDGKEDDDITNNLFIGHSIGAIYGYVQDGIVQEEDTEYMELTGSVPGDPKFRDLDGVEGISTNDRKILGYTKPKFKLSIGNTVRYKNLALFFRVSGTFGGNNYYLASNRRAFSSATPSRSSENGIYLPYWTPENKSNTYPAITYNPDARYLGLQSRSYMKLQRVSLSYDVNKNILNQVGIHSLKLFVTAEELFTITNWSGGDPEAGIGVASSAFPVTTNFSLGLNLNF